MDNKKRNFFELPDKVLTSLPTGAVKDTVEHLGRKIARGEYPTGAILPREDELVDSSVFRELLSEKPSRCFAAKGSFERHADMGLGSAPLTTGTFSIRTSFAGMTQEVRRLREFMRKQPTSD